jgi:hypothetical protein
VFVPRETSSVLSLHVKNQQEEKENLDNFKNNVHLVQALRVGRQPKPMQNAHAESMVKSQPTTSGVKHSYKRSETQSLDPLLKGCGNCTLRARVINSKV